MCYTRTDTHDLLRWELSNSRGLPTDRRQVLYHFLIFISIFYLLVYSPAQRGLGATNHDRKEINIKNVYTRETLSARCSHRTLDDVNPPNIAQTMKNHVADIACLPAPDFCIFQENFFSAYRKNKILFYFIKKLIFL